jgi:electron transport complex protein RnfB
VIDEQVCIGCTLCLQACPVDAILGAQKYMHTVIATECTGCELCIAPCPVDCISMTPIHGDLASNPVHIKQAADIARGRYEFRVARIARDQSTRAEQYAARRISPNTAAEQTDVLSTHLNTEPSPVDDKKAAIAAAMARAAALKSIPK